jgi:5'-phosphate synthase pdxT subunit
MRVGVLALQGAFREHIDALRRLGVEAVEVRLAGDLDALDALIIPGGESTTIVRLIDAFALREALVAFGRKGAPIWGTCAGAIVLAADVPDLDREPLGLLDITVERNAFGRQVDSFETDLTVAPLEDGPFHAVFIRAPVISGTGDGVTVLARLEDGQIVAVQQGNLLATSFHPELTADTRLHEYFLSCVREQRGV